MMVGILKLQLIKMKRVHGIMTNVYTVFIDGELRNFFKVSIDVGDRLEYYLIDGDSLEVYESFVTLEEIEEWYNGVK